MKSSVRGGSAKARQTLLVLDDDEGLRPSVQLSLERKGFEVIGVATAADAHAALRERHVALALLDINLPDGSGLDVLRTARELDEDTGVVMMTAFPELKTAIRAMKEGANDYLVKPFELEELHMTVERVLELRSLRREVQRLDRERIRRDGVSEILGESPAIRDLRVKIEKVASTDVPVLVLGETGTGKELVAESIHGNSTRADMPLVKVNCGTFSETLLESELFGHERGAFTDAKASRPGLFEMADGGTLFLDEVTEMRIDLQAKLLRVVEGQSFRRLGGQREIRANVRIVAATNRDLSAEVQHGRFREDLYFRLNVFAIAVPPLRQRDGDVVLLARRFLETAARNLKKDPPGLSPEAEELLASYPWPGNVRELRNVMERGVILADEGVVTELHLPLDVQASAFVRRAVHGDEESMPSLREVERQYIEFVRDSMEGNLSKAARVLGIARNTLKGRLRPPEEA